MFQSCCDGDYTRPEPDPVVPARQSFATQMFANKFAGSLINNYAKPLTIFKRDKFVNPYMHETGTSDDFLRNVQQNVPLHQCKKVMKSSYFDQNMPFAAIVTELKDDRLKQIYDGKSFLLEAWAGGNLLFQRAFSENIRVLNSSRKENSIIYMPAKADEPDDQKNIIYIVSLGADLNDKKMADIQVKERKVRDWTGLCNTEAVNQMNCMIDKKDVLYLSVQNAIHAVKLDSLNLQGQVLTAVSNTRKGKVDLTQVGSRQEYSSVTNFRCLIMCDSETSYKNEDSVIAMIDNMARLDFNKIVSKEDEQGNLLNIELIQLFELRNHQVYAASANTDKITQIRHVMLKGQSQVSVTLRESGQADLYWNCKLIHTSEQQSYVFKYQSIYLNFDQIVLKRSGGGIFTKPHWVVISLDKEQRTTFDDAKIQTEMNESMLIYLKCLKYRDMYRPYNDFLLYENSMLIAHSNIVSCYNINAEKFVAHQVFGAKPDATNSVLSIFRYQCEQNSDEEYGIGVLSQDGSINQCRVEETENSLAQQKFGEDETETSMSRNQKCKIQGQITRFAEDKHHNRALFAIASDNRFLVFMRGKEHRCPGVQVEAGTKIVPYFSTADSTQFIILNPQLSSLQVWKLEEGANGEQVTATKVKEFEPPQAFRANNSEDFHTALSTENNEALILFDKKHMYIFELKEGNREENDQADKGDQKTIADYELGELIIHDHMNIQNLQLIQGRHLYSLYNKVSLKQKHSEVVNPRQMTKFELLNSGNGMGYMDLKIILEDIRKTPFQTPITNAVVGCNDLIVYSEENQNIVFMQGVDGGLQIVPLLHQNLLPLQKMKPRKEYIFTSQVDDKFKALGYDNEVYVWDMQTGKLVSAKEEESNFDTRKQRRTDTFRISRFVAKTNDNDIRGWEVFRSHSEEKNDEIGLYNQGLFPYKLVYQTDSYKLNQEQWKKDFYKDRIMCYRSFQKNALEDVDKEFHNFAAVGLDEEGGITILTQFVFPRLKEQDIDQYLFLSNHHDMVLELTGEEAQLYELVESETPGSEMKVAKYLGRLANLPIGHCNGNAFQIYCLFSPDLKMHLDVDSSDQTWVVRQVQSGEIIAKIPRTLLSFNTLNQDEIIEQTRFMSWISENQISLVDIHSDPLVQQIIKIGKNQDSENNGIINEIEEQKDAGGQKTDVKITSENLVVSGSVPFIDIGPYQVSSESDGQRLHSGILNVFKAKRKLDQSDVQGRLKRIQTVLKQLWYIDDPKKTMDSLQDKFKDQEVDTGTAEEESQFRQFLKTFKPKSADDDQQTGTDQTPTWEQLKAKILEAIKKDEHPEVFEALLDDVRNLMAELYRTGQLAAFSVELQEDAAVFFSRRNTLSNSESKKTLQRINNILKKQQDLDIQKQAAQVNAADADQKVLTKEEQIEKNKKEEQKKKDKLKTKMYEKTYSQLFSIDSVTDHEKFFIETPFTFINWRMIEILQRLSWLSEYDAQERMAKRNLSSDVAQTISLNLLPELDTVLHRITKSLQITSFFCGKVQGGNTKDKPFPIPFIDNMQGDCPLEISLKKPDDVDEIQTENRLVAEYFLHTLLPNMPLDHHGRSLADVLPQCIEEGVGYVAEYLDSRFLQSNQLRKITRIDGGALKGGQDYCITASDLNPDVEIIKKKLIEEKNSEDDEDNDGGAIEVDLLDIPRIHNPNDPIAYDFIKALAGLEDPSYLFKCEGVKAIVEFRWNLCYQYIVWRQLVPYASFQFIYLFYVFNIMDLVEEYRMEPEFPGWLLFVQFIFYVLLIVGSAYFLIKEYEQFHKLKGKDDDRTFCDRFKEYYSDFWNYPDVIPPFLIVTIIILDTMTKDNPGITKYRITMQAIASFFMWIKLFYFLRIFRQTGFFVNMLMEVTKYVRTFLLLYFLILASFGCSFFIMSDKDGGDFLDNVEEQFLLGLGEFDMEWELTRVPWTAELFFLFATLVVLVIMMNILIAEVSTAYEIVMGQKEEANDFERAHLITNVEPLLSKKNKQELCQPDWFLIKASKNLRQGVQNDAQTDAQTDAQKDA